MQKILTYISKFFTFVYPVAVVIILALNLLPDNMLDDLLDVNFNSDFSEILFYTATTLSAGYYAALFILSYLANFKGEAGLYRYLVYLKSLTGIIFMITFFNSSYILVLFGFVDILLAGMYYLQYKYSLTGVNTG